jgi:aldehyde dehydrogenase (NAD+)
MNSIQQALKSLGLSENNVGAWSTDGGWSSDTTGPLIESYNPATEEIIGYVQAATPSDYERVIESARDVYRSWRKVPAPKRGEVIRLIADELRANKDALGTLVSLEMGKIKAEGDGEVQEMIDIADFAVGQSRMLYGLTMHSERAQHRMYEQWHPLGVVGIISAFNFPVAVWAWNAFLAAICGNVSVWKPSAKTPLCAIAVQHIVNRVLSRCGHTGVFQLFIDSGHTLADRFVSDRRVDLISFTGSTAIGRKVGEAVATRLGKSLLELGGNNAIIVDQFANLDLAVPAIVFGAVGTAGQRCTSTRRVFVHESRQNELEKRLVSAYAQVKIGNPLEPGVLMGPLIDAIAVGHYRSTIDTAQSQGGTLLCGGKVLSDRGNFVTPAIIRARNDMAVVQHETFAPILYIIPVRSIDDAITQQNHSHYGLSSAIFTDRLQHAEQFLSALGSDCGIANVNIGTSGAEIGGAFGGEKDTGGGRESGSDAWKSYMRRQTTTINWGSSLPLAQGIDFNLG